MNGYGKENYIYFGGKFEFEGNYINGKKIKK